MIWYSTVESCKWYSVIIQHHCTLSHSRCTGPDLRWEPVGSAVGKGEAGSAARTSSVPSAAPSGPAHPAGTRLGSGSDRGSATSEAASGRSASCADSACCVGEGAPSAMTGGAHASAQEPDPSEPAAARRNTEKTSDPSAADWCPEPLPETHTEGKQAL